MKYRGERSPDFFKHEIGEAVLRQDKESSLQITLCMGRNYFDVNLIFLLHAVGCLLNLHWLRCVKLPIAWHTRVQGQGTCECVRARAQVCVCVFMSVCVCVCMCVCVCGWIYMYVCMYVYIDIYIHI